ncbi:MAG: histone deacetylase family protein [Lentisphaerae bacterium]|nr:histone deacetylase family protein [Lentisphaerota bacterium]
MIRIRRIYSTVLPADRERLEQVKAIFRDSFPGVAHYAAKIADQIDHPFRYGYRAVLLVSDTPLGAVSGFALCFLLPEINSALLDYLAVAATVRGRGLGTSLYEAVREYLQYGKSRGLYLEAAPDDPAVVHDPAILEQNRRRLAFYERYGALPVTGTAYETPIDESPAPYLLFDGLGRDTPLGRREARAAVRLILRRKYADVVPPGYIERVAASFVADPVRFRPRRYTRARSRPAAVRRGRVQKDFAVIASDTHAVHRVQDQGYVERPARVGAIRKAVAGLDLFEAAAVRRHDEAHIRAVHAADFVRYLKAVCLRLEASRPVYPYVFPVRRPEKRPKELAVRAGYYCIDTFTPLDRNAYAAARAAVDVALTGADELIRGRHVAYAVCRPPGHHAQHRFFGGFCYFNNAAIAAQQLSARGRTAVLDIDYHHGNGTQDIFYRRADVLTVSLHGHPNIAYPYFSGFADETGEADGTGFNLNLPLAEHTGDLAYLKALDRALAAIRRFQPVYLVVSLGFDILKGDPTGSFTLRLPAMTEIGRRIAALGRPMLFVQEGGYNLRHLRSGVVRFFEGVARGAAEGHT